MPRISPCRTSKLTLWNAPRRPRPRTDTRRSTLGGRGPRDDGPQRPAHHQRNERLAIDLRGGIGPHVRSVAEHRDRIGDAEDLVHFVRDIDQGDAAPLEHGDHVEEGLDLPVGDRRRGLVHDEDAGILPQRLGNLDRLHLRHAEAPHLARHRQVGLQQVQEPPGLALHGAAVDPSRQARGRLVAQQDVFGHRQIGDRHQLLVDHGNAVADGILRAAEHDGPAAQQDLARVDPVQAGQHFHQRRFARAVLAHQRMHLAGPECQRNVHQCLDARERFADIARLEDGNAGDGSILLHTVRSILLPWLLPGKRQVNIEFTWQAPNVEQARHRAFHDQPAAHPPTFHPQPTRNPS